MLKDLANISNQVHEVKLCKEQCQNNSAEIERLQKKVTELEHKNQTLESQITKLEDYSRNHNLIIKGLPETRPKENIEHIVRDFFAKTLKVSNVGSMRFSCIHRLGRPPHLNLSPSKQPRDTIVRFENGLDRDIVWKERFKLKKSQFFLSEDFSPATQEKRRQLLPYLRAARKSPEVTRTRLARDMLFINGVKYTVHSLESLPYGIKNVNMAERYFTEGGVAFHGKHSFLSNFHHSPFTDDNHTFSTVEHHYQFKKATYFNGIPTANAILKAKSPN